MEKIRILFLASNPSDTARLNLDREIRKIKEAIRVSEHRDLLELESAWAVRPADLLHSLNAYKPHVVHFSGHGSELGEIVLVDEVGEPKPVSAKAIKTLFETLKDNIRLVVLNSCHSVIQAQAITETIDYAIAMNGAIEDNAAATFIASVYHAIGFGHTISNSFEQGKVALLLEGIPEEHVPQLLMRSGASSTFSFATSGDLHMNSKLQPKAVPELSLEAVQHSAKESSQTHILKATANAVSSSVGEQFKTPISPISSEVAVVELKIDRNFSDYTSIEQQRLLKAISQLLNVADDLRITRIRPGSVIISIELPQEKAKQLLNLVKAGRLNQFRVFDAEIIPVKKSSNQEQVTEARYASAVAQSTTGITSVGSRTRGTVKWFNDQKGFGFVTTESGGKDVFVHHSAIISSGFRSLAEGDKVEFSIEQGPKGPSAADVKKL